MAIRILRDDEELDIPIGQKKLPVSGQTQTGKYTELSKMLSPVKPDETVRPDFSKIQLKPINNLDKQSTVRELSPDEELDKPSMSFGEKVYKGIVAPTVEAGGLIAGGMAGSAVTPIAGTVGGAALGYAGARRLTKGGAVALGYDKPEKPLEAFKETGKDVVSGAAMEMGGQVAGKVIGKGLEKVLSRKVTPEMLKREALSKEVDVPTTPADIRQTKKTSLIESLLEKNLSTGDIVRDFRTKQLAAVNAYKETQLLKQGGGMDMLTAGAGAKAAGEAREAAWEKLYKPVYNRLNTLIPKDTPMNTPSLDAIANKYKPDLSAIKHETVQSILGKVTKPTVNIPETTSPIVDAYGRDIKTDAVIEKIWSWGKVDQTRKKLGDLIGESLRSGKRYEASIYTDMKHALDKDIQLYSDQAGGDIKATFDLANQLFREGSGNIPGATVYRSNLITKNILENTRPETIVNTFIKPNNPTNIKILNQAIGDEGMRNVKAAWMEKLFTSGQEQSFSPAKFSTAFNKYDKQTLNQFLSKDELSGLSKLSQISKMIQSAEKIAGNPSGTGQTLGTFGTLYLWVKHPIIMLGAEIGAKRFANLYFNNPAFRQYMIKGISVPPSVPLAAEMATKMMSVAANKRDDKSLDTTQDNGAYKELRNVLRAPERGK